jgi:hypothetical protein
MNHFGQFAAKKPKGASHIDHVDSHVEPIEHQNATGKRYARGGMRGGVCDRAPPSRAFRPWTMQVGGMNRLHVQTPMLSQTLEASKLDRWCLRRFHDFFLLYLFSPRRARGIQGTFFRENYEIFFIPTCQPPVSGSRMENVVCGTAVSCVGVRRFPKGERENDPIFM